MSETMMGQWSRRLRRHGRRQGEARLLLRLLERRFGPLGDEAREQVLAASSADLNAWADRFVTAPSLRHVLGERPRPGVHRSGVEWPQTSEQEI